ncbi:hypothetical protein COCMIDRAFT_8970 [Bipolaris oryzae ATCC 44560]|uniref:Uncharacterized protein n=1 Tax=Bipolaris oryzae ATCC 44560 TaxID=930090 RepID=W6Z0T8_COCMI|nr:uncharacterized protein COCMIDRAFT_8970 [Bipolaris oryzae ATCC 44560]EUC41289.1 hypothetical protein COCMIDRAFT_8970 [Bipolaris oryzae ATCC 44560]
MNLDILKERISINYVIKIAHVKLHDFKGKASIYLIIEKYYVSADEDGDEDEPNINELDAEQDDAEPRNTKNKSKAKLKYKFSKAKPSKFRNNLTHAITAYFVPTQVEGLITAREIKLIDMNIAPLIMTTKEREEYAEDLPFISPTNKLLEFKNDIKEPKTPTLLNGGRPYSKSLLTYRDNTTRELDKNAITANLRETADEHVALLRLQLRANMRPIGDQIMAQLYHFLSKRPHCRDENGHLRADKVQLFLE